ncbi:unnamed protein product [Closterium sp. NIES-54]
MLVLVDDHSRYSTVFFLHTKDQVPAVVIAWAEQCRTHFKRAISRLHSDGGGDYAFLHAALLLNLRSHPQHSYMFLHPPSGRLIRSIDIVFDESIPYYSTPPPDPLPPPSRPLASTDTDLSTLLPPAPWLGPIPTSHPSSLPHPSSHRSPLRSHLPPLPTSTTLPHPPLQHIQLHPLPPLPPPLTLPLSRRDSSRSSSSSSTRGSRGSRGSSGSGSSSSSGSRGISCSSSRCSSSRGSSSTRGSSTSSSSSSDAQLPSPPLSSSLACTPAPWTNSLEPLRPPPFSSSRTPMRKAITCTDADKWIAAIFQECEALIRNDTFVDVPLPTDANLVECKWVFWVKQLPGEEPIYKARYYAKGFTQTWAEDYWFTFAPTTKPPTFRTLLDIGARDNMEFCSMDVSNAFLQGDMHERIFLQRPPGFHAAFPENTVWQLCRPVYDLKQAPREWHAKLSATLGSLDFSALHSDAILFIRSSPHHFFILVYVDDMILLSDSKADMEQMKLSLQQRLKCKDLGDLTHYLGMAITRNRLARTITLSQSHYIGQVLEKFEMAQAKLVSTPLPFDHQLAPPTSPSSSSHPYAELVGSLMYAMMCTRPDLAYPISVLARFVGTGRHTTEHWQAAKWVLRYLRGTKDHVLTSPPLLSGFSDSSWADSQPDRRCSQGYGFTLGSGLVNWRSTRSSAMALSSCEAELYAGTMAAQESRWLCYLLAKLGAPQRCPTLWCDNASTIHLTQDPVYHARSKHIELRYFFNRELVQQGLLAVRKIMAEANLADIFTKALSRPAHSALLRLLGLARPGAP